MEDVKGSERPYSSPLRAQQADATRRAILDAARELFIAQGYGATTLEQIAARAGVSKPTVFSAVGNKQTVLASVRDVAMAGDDEKLSMVQRPLAEQIRREPDPYRAVELLAGLFTGVGRRYASPARASCGTQARSSGSPAPGSGPRAWPARAGCAMASISTRRPICSGCTWHRTSTTGSSTSAAGPTIASDAG
jgi:AcrR family transcriptional regulator